MGVDGAFLAGGLSLDEVGLGVEDSMGPTPEGAVSVGVVKSKAAGHGAAG